MPPGRVVAQEVMTLARELIEPDGLGENVLHSRRIGGEGLLHHMGAGGVAEGDSAAGLAEKGNQPR